MTYANTIPPIAELKQQAKRLRNRLQGNGTAMSHSEALEMIAHQHGARDWNTLRAGTGNMPPPPQFGETVTGRYLGQPFVGVVHGITKVGETGNLQITLQLDKPVDVVTFDSFSNFRQRISTMIDVNGVSPRKTSNGLPQLVVDRPEA